MTNATTDRAPTGRLTNAERASRLERAERLLREVAADMNRGRVPACPCASCGVTRFAHYGEATFAMDLDGAADKVARYAGRARAGLPAEKPE